MFCTGIKGDHTPGFLGVVDIEGVSVCKYLGKGREGGRRRIDGEKNNEGREGGTQAVIPSCLFILLYLCCVYPFIESSS